jgi:predicted Rossmann-fold nucleotide-binding protein
MKKIGIIGPNKSMCDQKLYEFGVHLGRQTATNARTFVCGGLGGFMEAVCKGVKQSPDTFNGQTIGILPDAVTDNVNAYIDIPIATGAGTLSEIAFAWQQKKTVLCVTLFDGWSKELAGRNLDNRANGLLIPVNSIDEINQFLNQLQ